MSKPVDANPLKDPTGARCAQGQSGPVFFLAGSSTRLFQVRDKCVVPAGNVLFFPVVNGVVRHRRRKLGAAGPANNDFRACAGTVRRCSAPAFSLTLPDQNLFGIAAGKYRPAAADGYYLMLKPLPKGCRTITFGGAGHFFGDFTQNTTYHLTVA